MIRHIPEPPSLETRAARDGARTLLTIQGEIDLATVEQFQAAVREHLATGPVLLEMRKTTFMDSTGVRALDELLRQADGDGSTLKIRADMHRNVRHVLELTGVLDVCELQEPPADGAAG